MLDRATQRATGTEHARTTQRNNQDAHFFDPLIGGGGAGPTPPEEEQVNADGQEMPVATFTTRRIMRHAEELAEQAARLNVERNMDFEAEYEEEGYDFMNEKSQIEDIQAVLGYTDDRVYLYYLLRNNSRKLLKEKLTYDGNTLRVVSVDTNKNFNQTKVFVKRRLIPGTQSYNINYCRISVPKDFSTSDYRKELSIKLLSLIINKGLHANVDNLAKEINATAEKINLLGSQLDESQSSYWRKTVSALKKQLLKSQDKTKKMSVEGFIEEIKKIKKHSLVHSVYITDTGILLVKTKSLKALDWSKPKPTKETIGSLVFYIRFTNPSYLDVFADNLDYMSVSHPHPQISGTEICWGNESPTVHNFKKAGELYAMVDYLILFMSTIYQENSTYFVHPEEWMKGKTKRTSGINFNEWFNIDRSPTRTWKM
jgi:hypothetical protein